MGFCTSYGDMSKVKVSLNILEALESGDFKDLINVELNGISFNNLVGVIEGIVHFVEHIVKGMTESVPELIERSQELITSGGEVVGAAPDEIQALEGVSSSWIEKLLSKMKLIFLNFQSTTDGANDSRGTIRHVFS
jgi:hypothetical protein